MDAESALGIDVDSFVPPYALSRGPSLLLDVAVLGFGVGLALLLGEVIRTVSKTHTNVTIDRLSIS